MKPTSQTTVFQQITQGTMMNTESTFDCQHVQRDTRRRIAHHTALIGALVTLSGAALFIIVASVRQSVGWAVGIGSVCTLPIAFTGYRIYRLSQIVWFIRITPKQVEGYDYARRKIRVAWSQMKRVDITRRALTLTSTEGRILTLPPTFASYGTIGHLIFDHARARGVPVYIDGESWDSLSIYALFPFLKDDRPAAF